MTISSKNLSFVYLHKRQYVEASVYPYFTMLGQSIGSIVLGREYRYILGGTTRYSTKVYYT